MSNNSASAKPCGASCSGARGGGGGGENTEGGDESTKEKSGTCGKNYRSGKDTNGRHYRSEFDMWRSELTGDLYDRKTGWYGKSLTYWEKIPATVSGVLGGMDHVHDIDVSHSRAFIESLENRGTHYALDCGAGIGRVTKSLLSTMYDMTDLLEPVPHMLEQARRELEGLPVGEFMQTSMQTASLPKNMYDLIVIQWCAIYLTDDDFVKFFAQCREALTPSGYIFFKENCFSDDYFLVDKDDNSLTRSDAHYKRLFDAAGVTVRKEQLQNKWPSNLIEVKMYALR